MKILYAIQGTGNGHICRALEIIPQLQKKADVDILVSGTQGDIDIPFPVRYRLYGISFIFGKNGGVDLWRTFQKNNFRKFIIDLWRLPLKRYDLVINDFEPVSAWASRLRRRPCFSLSHQAALLNKAAPAPLKKDFLGKLILEHYAPSDKKYGFHFSALDPNIFRPIIRQQVRHLQPSVGAHYTVYLPSYSDKKLIKLFRHFPETKWQVFSKHNKKALHKGNIEIFPIDNETFLKSLASCKGVICGAGFETPAEAMFLKKKLLVVPMKNQYEQYCNGAALKKSGVEVLSNLKSKNIPNIKNWLKLDNSIQVDYPDETEKIIDLLLVDYITNYVPFHNPVPIMSMEAV